MAITLEIRVCDLLPEFLADALVFLGALQAAGAITAGPFQAFPDGFHYFLVFIQSDCHRLTSLPGDYSTDIRELQILIYRSVRITES